jgi:hypothetical protein
MNRRFGETLLLATYFTYFSETSVDFQRAMRYFIPDDGTLQNHGCANAADLTEGFRGFSQSLQATSGIVSELDLNRFLPNPFQFIIH